MGAHIYNTIHHSQCTSKTGVKILIRDGMGFAHIRVTELVYGYLNMTSQPYWFTAYEQTDSLSEEVTDSSAGTAIATGFKTYNGMISTIKLNGELLHHWRLQNILVNQLYLLLMLRIDIWRRKLQNNWLLVRLMFYSGFSGYSLL